MPDADPCLMHWRPLTTRLRTLPPGRSRPWAAVAVLVSCGATVPLVGILPVPLLPELPALLHTSLGTTSWCLTAALLSAAVSTPVAGRAGDLYGKRLMLAVSLGLLAAGSLLCGSADSVAVLITGRAVQGCAAGALPLSYGILRDELTPERLPSGLAAMSTAVGAVGAAGFPLAAVVAHTAGWHALFLGTGAFSVAGLILVLTVVRAAPRSDPGHFDILGAVTLTVGIGCLLLAVTIGPEWGWASVGTLAVIAVAGVAIAAWCRIELRIPDPLVDIRTALARPVLVTNVASFLVGFAMYAMSVIIPQLLEAPVRSRYGVGLSVAAAGICLAPSGVTMMLLSPASARFSARWGPAATLAAGAITISAAYGACTLLPLGVGPVLIVVSVVGAGLAFTYMAMPALILRAVPPAQSAAANGVNLLVRSVGAAVASAALGAVLGTMTETIRQADTDVTVPSAMAFRVVFLLAATAALAGAAVAAIPVSAAGQQPPGAVHRAVHRSGTQGNDDRRRIP
jgi:MFS family permease